MESHQSLILGRSIVAGARADVSPVPFHSYRPGLRVTASETYFAAMPSDVDRAARSAAEAFQTFRDNPGCRGAMLDAIAAGLLDEGESLILTACDETGLPVPRITMERDRTVRQLRMFAEIVRDGSWVEAVIDHGDPSRVPVPKPDVRRMLRPLGPVAVFGASNFPLAYSVAGGDTASAFAAGCPVVVKGHSAHPKTGEIVATVVSRSVEDVGLHPGAFSFLHSGGERDVSVGVELLEHPSIKAGGFTGSVAAGMALATIAQNRPTPIPFFAEMGSVNPIVVMPKALAENAEQIATKIVQSAFASSGQMCTCPGLIFLVRGAGAELFKERVARESNSIRNVTFLSPRIERIWRQGVVAAERCGAVRLTEADDSCRAVALVVEAGVLLANPQLMHENFGPSTIIVECGAIADVHECLSHIGGTLTATMWCEEAEPESAEVLASLETIAGRVVVNAVPTGVEVCDAMIHSGPFPACNRPDSTAVGASAIRRWCRPVAFQNLPQTMLPIALRDENELGIRRLVDGVLEV